MKLAYFLKDATASGGMERVLSNKCAWWCAQGHEVHVVSLVDPQGREPFFPFPAQVRHHNLGLQRIYRKGLANKLRKGRNVEAFVAAADRWLTQFQPDIAISMFDEYSRHLPRTRHACRKVGELHFAKHKSAQHMYRLERTAAGRALCRLYKHADYRLIGGYDAFVTLTAQDAEAWGRLPNITSIPNAASFVCPTRAPLDSKQVIALGRNTRQKRFDRLLEAWSRVAPRHPDATLRIVGPGGKDDLRRLAHRLGIESQVTLDDAVRDVPGALMQASVLALSSQYEGFAMVLLEAMSCGLPVVASDCRSGPAEIVTHGEDGFLVAPGDIEGMAAALDRLLSDPSLRDAMGAAAHRNIARFSEQAVMARWQALFEGLLRA